jgi:hypothetical protein
MWLVAKGGGNTEEAANMAGSYQTLHGLEWMNFHISILLLGLKISSFCFCKFVVHQSVISTISTRSQYRCSPDGNLLTRTAKGVGIIEREDSYYWRTFMVLSRPSSKLILFQRLRKDIWNRSGMPSPGHDSKRIPPECKSETLQLSHIARYIAS